MKTRIDFLDTSTMPTLEMRQAMFEAEVGDDVYGEDPTINQLEPEAAAMVGKEAAMFVPSGTMGNLTALMAHTKRGQEIVLESESHIYYYEAGGFSAVAGLSPRLVEGRRGVLDAERVRAALRPPDDHYPRSTLLAVENTHNRGGGSVTPVENMKALREVCDEHGLKFHMDGARLFHAAVALDVPVTDLTQHVDTVMFCLSKGLGAPVGSMLAGDEASLRRAREARKMLGGGMRQAGVLAAAGLVSLHEGTERLAEDHRLAKELANMLAQIPGIAVEPEHVETNIVLIDLSPSNLTSQQISQGMLEREIKVSGRPPAGIRMVTHRGIDDQAIETAASALGDVIRSLT